MSAVRDDEVEADLERFKRSVRISAEELRSRLADWTLHSPPYTKGSLGKYIKLVQLAANGAVTG